MAVNLWLLTLLKKFHGGDLLSILQHSSTPEARFPVLTAQIVIYTTRRCWTHRRASRPTLSPGQTDSQVNASWKLAFNFRFLWPFTLWSCTDFRRLPLTLVEFKFVRKSTQVFHHLATQHKSLRKFWFCKFALTCESVYPGCQRFSKRRAATRREERLVNRFSWHIVAWEWDSASPTIRGFLSPFLSLSCLAAKGNLWDQGGVCLARALANSLRIG